MIVAEQKPLAEIRQMIKGHRKVLLVGCGSCVTVCFAGGAKEVGILASSLRLAAQIDGDDLEVTEETVLRQCEPEFVETLRRKVEDADIVVSLACGVGPQTMVEAFPNARIVPGLNTKFFGRVLGPGVWTETCAGCGNCILHLTGGICPVARCSKSLLNGPCGGSVGGKCEVSPDIKCVWQEIYDHLAVQGKAENLAEIIEEKDWSTAGHGGPRTITRKDLQI
ncbi:MAG: methylenetetrahydrofolate reductase C-terminal domain-containing protein [Bacteroidetes bacterium]|nr:methylenetetrahydrofolate reductase C-terminal domain-containing protein [Bacteroidota bacterium]MCL5025524.1 methylenetetrahydrofolate reductase C-terminal domain-containing protein [Chloroflexota bacterium]